MDKSVQIPRVKDVKKKVVWQPQTRTKFGKDTKSKECKRKSYNHRNGNSDKSGQILEQNPQHLVIHRIGERRIAGFEER